MDVVYEESAVNQQEKKQRKIYKILHIVSLIFLVLAIISLALFLPNLISSFASMSPTENITQEQINQVLAQARSLAVFFGFWSLSFFLFWFMFRTLKKRVNVSYDYTFVTGELRISKVFNINRRKFLYRIQSEEIMQIGDIENQSYDRLKSDPNTKQIILTPNAVPAEGKFFMYILTNISGKKLLILECREELLIQILKFVKRGTLESDYVAQEKKERRN